MATGRCADASTHLDVDEFILDYLIFTATKALLEDYSRLKDRRVEAQEQGASNIPLQLVDCKSYWLPRKLLAYLMYSLPHHVPHNASRPPG